MLILQILLVPVFVLLLLGIVFVIGAAGTSPAQYDHQDDAPIIQI